MVGEDNEKQRRGAWRLRSRLAFAPLFGRVLIAQGQPVPATRREVVKALAGNLGWDASSFEQVLDVRERRADSKQFKVEAGAAQDLAAGEQGSAPVDRLLDPPGAQS